MSKLSELLNPAPTSTSQQSSTAPPAPQVQPLVIDGRDHRTPSMSHASPSHTRIPSLTSPGLDALADLASNTAPILSPTTHHHSNSFGSYQPSYERYGSRPVSSHTLPPLGEGSLNGTGHQQPAYSSGLGQYHHPGSDERRVEESSGTATTLPPLHGSPTEQHYSSGFEQLSEASKHVNGGPQDSFTFPSLQSEGLIVTRDQDMPDASATTQIRQPSPGPSLQSTNLPAAQTDQVEVKAELTENPLPTSQIESEVKEGPGAILAQSFTTMGSPAPKNLKDIKKDGSNTPTPMPTENAAVPPPSKPKPEKTNKKRPAPSSTNKKGTANTVKRSHKKRKIEPENGENTPSAQRTGTPATSRASMTPALQNRKQGSVTPARSSSATRGDDESEEDDNAIYCICRKPDDHNLMIGCDGPCGDWYHTKCVNMEGGKHRLISVWYLRGDVMRAEELKALTDEAKDIQSFHRLGDGVLSPPATASPEGEDVKTGPGTSAPKERVTYTMEEQAQLDAITEKRAVCRERKKMLDDRDRFIVSITVRQKSVLAELKEKDKSIKDICGYDSRLSWSDPEFNQWRASPDGQKALAQGGVLSAPTHIDNGELRNDEEEEEVGKGVCKKKRCERHKAWLKLAQQENLFEKDQARQEMKGLEGEEKGVKDRALIRTLELGEGVGG
ncbi:hypothetical protein P7C71_g4711, partial [Lecanoromycetidae sp. Uapishka_2]